MEAADADRLGDDVEERPGGQFDVERRRACGRMQDNRPNRIHHLGVGGDLVRVQEGKDGIQVHRRAVLRHGSDDDLAGRALLEQAHGQLAHALPRGALAHAYQDDALAYRHDVTALERRQARVLIRVAIPELKVRLRKPRVVVIDGPGEQGFLVSGRQTHGVE